jgi:phosphoserine/homoserine phosphotransferase
MESSSPSQFLVTLDVEGVLTPEIWIAVAGHFGIDALKKTTKDEPDYQLLMEERIGLINKHNISLSDIQSVISLLSPLDGALDFLTELRSTVSVVLLSDTFEEFIGPLMIQLQNPLVLCHRLVTNHEGYISSFAERTPNQKFEAVCAFQKLNYQVIAAGDSYNDLSMIDQADAGFLFRAPDHVRNERSDLTCFDDYSDLLSSINEIIENDC